MSNSELNGYMNTGYNEGDLQHIYISGKLRQQCIKPDASKQSCENYKHLAM